MLLNGCYQPTQWDIYWRLDPCDFVMRRVEREEKLFGTPAMTEAWVRAVMRHPLAYLRHRSAFMWNFLAGDNLAMWLVDVERPAMTVFADRPAFVALVRLHDVLKPTPLFACRLMAAGVHHRVRIRLAATRDAAKALSRSASAGRRRSTC